MRTLTTHLSDADTLFAGMQYWRARGVAIGDAVACEQVGLFGTQTVTGTATVIRNGPAVEWQGAFVDPTSWSAIQPRITFDDTLTVVERLDADKSGT